MKIITVANAAGSAGKTTTVVTLAALLAQRGQRVVVVDLDGQANCTRWLGHHPDDIEVTSGSVLLREHTLAEALVPTNVDGVRLVPASDAVYGQAIALQMVTGSREMRLRNALRKLTDTDVVLIDCPGSIGIMTISALVASDEAITVTQPSGKELEGVPAMEAVVDEVSEDHDTGLRLSAIVPCIVPPASAGTMYSDSITMLRERYGAIVTPSVRRSVRAAEAYSFAEPLPMFGPREAVTQDYVAVLDDLVARGVVAK